MRSGEFRPAVVDLVREPPESTPGVVLLLHAASGAVPRRGGCPRRRSRGEMAGAMPGLDGPRSLLTQRRLLRSSSPPALSCRRWLHAFKLSDRGASGPGAFFAPRRLIVEVRSQSTPIDAGLGAFHKGDRDALSTFNAGRAFLRETAARKETAATGLQTKGKENGAASCAGTGRQSPRGRSTRGPGVFFFFFFSFFFSPSSSGLFFGAAVAGRRPRQAARPRAGAAAWSPGAAAAGGAGAGAALLGLGTAGAGAGTGPCASNLGAGAAGAGAARARDARRRGPARRRRRRAGRRGLLAAAAAGAAGAGAAAAPARPWAPGVPP